MSLLTSPRQPPPAPPASSPPLPSAVPNDPQSPKQPKEPLSHRLNDFMASKPKMHCLRSLRRGVSVCVHPALCVTVCVCVFVFAPVPELQLHCMSEAISIYCQINSALKQEMFFDPNGFTHTLFSLFASLACFCRG